MGVARSGLWAPDCRCLLFSHEEQVLLQQSFFLIIYLLAHTDGLYFVPEKYCWRPQSDSTEGSFWEPLFLQSFHGQVACHGKRVSALRVYVQPAGAGKLVTPQCKSTRAS